MLKTPTQSKNVSLSGLYAPVADELDEVERVLANELSSKYEFVNELLSKSHRLSGKRLRPALLLLVAKACGSVTAEHIKLAAAIEMVHTATLIHDDILDSADRRRHEKTLNCEFGNQAAILTGDFLFSHAFFLTSTLTTTYAAQEIGKSTNIVCEGEIRQIGTQARFDVTEDEYFEIIDSKTAVLCSCAAKLGAHYANASDQVNEAAANYGTNLGIAFQIVDDLLDITGSETQTGKSLGTDLQQQKPTLPLIHLLQSMNESERENFCNKLTGNLITVDEIRSRLVSSNSLKYASEKAAEFARIARTQLTNLPDSDSKSILAQLPSFVLGRTH